MYACVFFSIFAANRVTPFLKLVAVMLIKCWSDNSVLVVSWFVCFNYGSNSSVVGSVKLAAALNMLLLSNRWICKQKHRYVYAEYGTNFVRKFPSTAYVKN